jgi:signal transduction histidine kinase
MAAPDMRRIAAEIAPQRVERQPRMVRGRAAMRLLSADRSDEIFPVLLEEIIALGFPRAMVLQVDFETGEIKPVAALKCPRSYLKSAVTSLWASDNPIVNTLHRLSPAVLPTIPFNHGPWYCHPLIYRNQHFCWEAERERRRDCLAVLNYRETRKLQLREQVCSACDMRAYASVILVKLPRGYSERQVEDCRALIELGNRYLSRLFKVEHYYNRMRDMDATIGQMQTVMESMSDPVILTDAHYRVIMQNRAAEKYFKAPENVSEGGARAVEFNNLLFSAALSSMAVSGTETSRDLTLVEVVEGEEALFEAVCAPTHNREGIRTGMVTVMRDVTDLRRADQELRASVEKLLQAEEVVRQDRDRLNLVIENVGDPIVVADSAAKVVLLDPLARELFGSPDQRPTAEVVRNLAKLDAYLTSFTFSFADKDSANLRLYQRSSNSEVEYEGRSGKIYDARGQVSYTVTVLRDFSAWKKLEQLKLERRMLEVEKFAATGRLAGTIAHEVNNPMEAIKNAIVLLDGQVKPDAQEIYNILRGETERVARIVRQMLGLYRTSDQVRTMDVNTVIEDTLTLFARQLERSSIKVSSRLGKLPQVVGSADQLRQVMSNLVVNAKDSMPEGGQLIVRTRQVPSPDGVHGWVRIVVADTGTGIPPSVLPTVFDPFVSTKGEKGTGLGLWIVRGIVENHGGRIRLRSKPGKGTIFKLDFPVVR